MVKVFVYIIISFGALYLISYGSLRVMGVYEYRLLSDGERIMWYHWVYGESNTWCDDVIQFIFNPAYKTEKYLFEIRRG